MRRTLTVSSSPIGGSAYDRSGVRRRVGEPLSPSGRNLTTERCSSGRSIPDVLSGHPKRNERVIMADGRRRRPKRHLGLVFGCVAMVFAAIAAEASAAPTITVTPTSPSPCSTDGATCTLRGAVDVANANPGTTINVTPGSYGVASHELEVTGYNTTIQATGPGVEISATAGPRAFLIQGDGTQIIGMQIKGRSAGQNVSSTDTDRGGAIDFHPTDPEATLALIGVQVSGGEAAYGGNIFQHGGGLYIADSRIDGGSARGQGGGLFAMNGAVAVLDGVSFAYNHADSPGNGGGGAVAADGASIVALNSTFAHNTANNGNGASDTTGGAFLITRGGQLTLNNVTVANNGTLGSSEIAGDATSGLTFTNSILGAPQAGSVVCALRGAAVTDNHSIAGDASCGLHPANGSVANVDPKLFPYDAYGWVTSIVPPAPDSPAIDAADPASCPPIDQRYTPRPQGGSCDIGAVESPFTAAPANPGSSPAPGGGGGGGGGGATRPAPAPEDSAGSAAAPQPAPAPAQVPPASATPVAPAPPAPVIGSRLQRNGILTVRGRLQADPKGAITVRWTVRKGGKRHHGAKRMRSGDRVLSGRVRLPRNLRGARLVTVAVSYTDTAGKKHKQKL